MSETVSKASSLTRRSFVKASGAVAGLGMAGAMVGCASGQEASQGGGSQTEEGEWIATSCNMCFNSCSILAHVVDGTVVELKGDDRSPIGWGHMCGKGAAGIMQLYDPNRITKPMKRTNPKKGLDEDPGWEEISWDEAYQITADKIMEQADEGLPVIVFALITSLQTWINAMNMIGSMGAIPVPLKADICGGPVHNIGFILTSCGNACPDYRYNKYLLQFGTQAGVATRHGTNVVAKIYAESRLDGQKVVNFDPHMSGGAEKADTWVPVLPGTDAAVALGISNQLVNELGIYDADFLTKRTNAPALVDPDTQRILRAEGSNKALYWDQSDNTAKPYDEAKDPALEGTFDVNGKQCPTAFVLYKQHMTTYTPEYVEQVSTVPADQLRQIAKEFGEAAHIGETIDIDGVKVPYRPVCADAFSGISRHKHGFLSHWAITQLNCLVGSIHSAGGLLGYYTKSNGWGPDGYYGWEPGVWEEDGFLESTQMAEPPAPVSVYEEIRETDCIPVDETMQQLQPITMNQHFGYLTQVDPELFHTDKFQTTPSKLAMVVAANPLKNWCEYEQQEKLLRSFEYVIGMDLFLNDSSYFYDLIIPEPCYLERYEPLPLGFDNHRLPGLLEVPWAVTFRAPVVDAKDDVPSAIDTFAAIAEKAGTTKEFHGAMKDQFKIKDEYALDDSKPMVASELVDAVLKTYTEGNDLAYSREHGIYTRDRTVDEVYIWADENAPGKVPLYFDFMMEAKEKVEAALAQLEITNWETEDYQPLPDWKPCIDHEVTDPEYDVLPVYWTNAVNTDTWQLENPWINEINQQDETTYGIEMNEATAAAKGLVSGDAIRLTSRHGRSVEGRVVVTKTVHPQCVSVLGGHWNTQSEYLPVGRQHGVGINDLIDFRDTSRLDHVCTAVDQCIRVKVEKL